MTIERASDNPFPSILIEESTEPTAPPAGQQRLYVDSTTHLLKATNSSGTDRTIEGIAAGAITSSGLTMATARLLGRTTASTGAVEEITVGTGLTLSAGSLVATGSSGVSAGTSFPGGPSTGDLFWRTDLKLLCTYDGTRWVTVQEYAISAVGESLQPMTVVGAISALPVDNTYDLYVTRILASLFINGTNNGSNYWTLTGNKVATNNSSTSLGTVNTSADAGSTWLPKTITVNAVVVKGTYPLIRLNMSTTGSPSGLYFTSVTLYRLVVT